MIRRTALALACLLLALTPLAPAHEGHDGEDGHIPTHDGPRVDPAAVAARLAFLPDILATFDTDRQVTRDAFLKLHAARLAFVLRPGTTDTEIKVRLTAPVTAMANQMLLTDLATEAGMKPDRDAVRAQITKGMEFVPEDSPEFQQALSSAADQLMVRAWIEETFKDKADIDEADIAAFYKENEALVPEQEHASARFSAIIIIIPPGDDARAKAQQTITDLARQLEDGADFATLAREHSDDTRSASHGGDIGFMDLPDLPMEVTQALTPLKIGEHSPVIETRGSFQILQLTGRRQPGKIPLDSAMRDDIREFLTYQAVEKALGERLEAEAKARHFKLTF